MRLSVYFVVLTCFVAPLDSLAQVVTIEHEGGDEPVI